MAQAKESQVSFAILGNVTGALSPITKMDPSWTWGHCRRPHFASVVAVGAKAYVTFYKMHVFFGRGVEGKGGKGDRVNPIPKWL